MTGPVTERGFRVFHREDRLSVIESSLALEGPHVRVYGGRPIDGHESVHLSLVDAKAVRDALTTFIDEAEAGSLTEVPA